MPRSTPLGGIPYLLPHVPRKSGPPAVIMDRLQPKAHVVLFKWNLTALWRP